MTLTIALAKGRTTAQVLPLLSAAGIDCTALQEKSRRLLFTDDPDFHFVLVKAPDVLTYLNRGTVDIGIVGSDILEEQGHQQFDLLDLRTGRCRFILASTPDFDPHQTSRKRIATKYPHIAQRYFQDQGEDVEMIKIEGSVELAPLTGMADSIVDITETGTTLRENHLKVFATLTPVSTHLVVNRLALKQKKTAIYQLIQALKRVRPQEV